MERYLVSTAFSKAARPLVPGKAGSSLLQKETHSSTLSNQEVINCRILFRAEVRTDEG
jgi:hypothetical protein